MNTNTGGTFKKIFTLQESTSMDEERKWIIRRDCGAINGVELCELVGSFSCYQLSKKHNKKDIDFHKRRE